MDGKGLTFPYSEAKKVLNIKSDDTVCEGFKKLVKVGLIDILSRGNRNTGKETRYAISDRWNKYGTREFVKGVYEKIGTPAGFDAPKRRLQKIPATEVRSKPATGIRSGEQKPQSCPLRESVVNECNQLEEVTSGDSIN